MQLTTKQISLPTPPYTPPPSQSVQFVKPLSYEFRVAETLGHNGKVAKVSLQMCIWEHDEFGTGTVKQTWTDVPRVKFDANGAMLLP